MLKDLNRHFAKEKILVALLTTVQFFNILDFVIMMPLGPNFIRFFSITPAQFGMLVSSYSFSAAFSALIYSSVADKYNRKSFLVIALIFFTLATFICAVAPTYNSLLIARIIAGFFGGVITPIIYSIITDLIPVERRGKAFGSIMASFSITSILGIPLGLAIADYLSWRYTFFFIGIGATVVLFIAFFLIPSIPLNKIALKPLDVLKRLIRITFQAEHRLPYFSIFLFTSSGFLLFPFLSPYAVKNIGILETDIKYIYLVGGFFTIFASKYSGFLTDKYGSLKVFLPSVFLSLPFIYLYTSVENMNLAPLLIISSGFMVIINFRFVPVMTLISCVPDEQSRGSFMGILISLRSLSSALATSFAGYMITINSQGLLLHFDLIGYLSVALSLIGTFLVFKLSQQVHSKTQEKQGVTI